jgi:peptide deformylase
MDDSLTPETSAPHRVPRPREIVVAPAAILKRASFEVKVNEVRDDAGRFAELQALVDDMIVTMRQHHGIGLSAVQVGERVRVVIADLREVKVTSGTPAQPPIVIVNPRVVQRVGAVTAAEGCLSIPGRAVRLRRAQRITVTGFDRDLQPLHLTLEGLLARVIQHEVDHLDGILMTDRAGK